MTKETENLNNADTPSLNIAGVSCSYFHSKFRIITDNFNGFEVQIKRWWFPFWVQCNYYDLVNSFSSIKEAKDWIKKGRPKHKS